MERAATANWPAPERVEVDGVGLAVRRRSGRGPTVVFESGLGLPALLWRSVWERLPRDMALVCYDRSGLGDSVAETSPQGALAQAGQLRAMLGALGIDPPYLLVGHSAGAFVVRLLAIEEPQHVAGLVLVDPSHEDDPEASAAVDEIVNASLRALSRLPVAMLGDPLRWLSARSGPRAAQRLQLAAAVSSPSHLRGALSENRAHLTSVAQVLAARQNHPDPQVPLTVITARSTAARRSGSRRWAARYERDAGLAAASTDGRHLIAERSGHLVPLDAPEVVVEALRQLMPEGASEAESECARRDSNP